MRTDMSEITDLALTQAIERYVEMDLDDVLEAIPREWPEQISVLLTVLVFSVTRGSYWGLPGFIQFSRDQSNSTYLAPACICNPKEWRQK